MPIITLTSDWGTNDHYTGMVKGSILSRIPNATIIDITHDIPPFNLNSASFILRNVIPTFPKGTIHIIDINSDATIEMPHTVLAINGQYLIGADNGLFSLILDSKPEEAFEIDMIQDSDCFTFSACDIFIKIAKHIVDGKELSEVGPPRKSLTQRFPLKPVTSESMIKGHIIYIDRYQNAFTNITKPMFLKVGKKRPFTISFSSTRYQVKKIKDSYKDPTQGNILALFSYTGHLQIAMSNGNAAGLLGFKVSDTVMVEFHG